MSWGAPVESYVQATSRILAGKELLLLDLVSFAKIIPLRGRVSETDGSIGFTPQILKCSCWWNSCPRWCLCKACEEKWSFLTGYQKEPRPRMVDLEENRGLEGDLVNNIRGDRHTRNYQIFCLWLTHWCPEVVWMAMWVGSGWKEEDRTRIVSRWNGWEKTKEKNFWNNFQGWDFALGKWVI